MQTRADQIFESFKEYHRAHPRIWKLFEFFTQAAIASGNPRYSADAVCHRIRWHLEVEVKEERFKVNNNFTAYLARLFMTAHPEHDGFFETRKRKSVDRIASNPDNELTFLIQREEEDPLREELLKLL